MFNLLRKLFIKDYANVHDPKIRTKHGYLAAIVGIITNLILVSIKITIGALIFSMSIISDAINNLTDMAGCFVNLFGFKLASKPADRDHPFGHERIENIAGLIISFITIVIAVIAGYTSVNKIINNELTDYSNSIFAIATIIILVLAILTKLWQYTFYSKMSKAISSISLKANAQDSLNDVISTSFVLIATIVEFTLSRFGHYVQIDGYVGLIVNIVIVVLGIKMAIETIDPLIGVSPDASLMKNIVKDIESMDGVLGIHDLMAHTYGPTKIFMTIHIEVDAKSDIMASHELMDNIEIMVYLKYGVMCTCHMDPIVTDDPLINELKNYLDQYLKELNPTLTYHDFRIVKGESHTNVLFDVLTNFDVKIKDDQIISYLRNKFSEIDPRYLLVVKIDKTYIND